MPPGPGHLVSPRLDPCGHAGTTVPSRSMRACWDYCVPSRSIGRFMGLAPIYTIRFNGPGPGLSRGMFFDCFVRCSTCSLAFVAFYYVMLCGSSSTAIVLPGWPASGAPHLASIRGPPPGQHQGPLTLANIHRCVGMAVQLQPQRVHLSTPRGVLSFMWLASEQPGGGSR